MLSSATLDSREDTIIKELITDEEFVHLYNYLVNPDEYIGLDKESLQSRASNYEIIDELLFYKKQLNTFGDLRQVIPVSLRGELLREFHDLHTAAHPGIRKTFSKLSDSVF